MEKVILKNENSSLKSNNNCNIKILNNKPSLLSPSRLSINSKLSFAKEVSTDEINIYNNIKNEIILINQNTKKIHKLKEIKSRNNHINFLTSQTTNRLLLNNNSKNNTIENTIKNEKENINFGNNNTNLKNRNYNDTNREINKNDIKNIDENKNETNSMQCLFCSKVFSDYEHFKNFNC